MNDETRVLIMVAFLVFILIGLWITRHRRKPDKQDDKGFPVDRDYSQKIADQVSQDFMTNAAYSDFECNVHHDDHHEK